MATLRDAGEGADAPQLPIENAYESEASKKSEVQKEIRKSMVGLRAGTNTNLGHILSQMTEDERGAIGELHEDLEDENEWIQSKMLDASREPGETEFHRRLRVWRKKLKDTTKLHKELVHNGKAMTGKIWKRGEEVEVWKSHPFPGPREVVMHKSFETTMAILILTNCVVIGFQAELRNPEGALKAINMLLEHVFTLVFFVELVLRSLVYNWTFWFDQ